MSAQRSFQIHAATWAAVNGFLFLIWLLTMPGGFPWFLFPAGGWGIALAIHAVATFGDPGDDDELLPPPERPSLRDASPTVDEVARAEDPARYRTLGQ